MNANQLLPLLAAITCKKVRQHLAVEPHHFDQIRANVLDELHDYLSLVHFLNQPWVASLTEGRPMWHHKPDGSLRSLVWMSTHMPHADDTALCIWGDRIESIETGRINLQHLSPFYQIP